MCDLCDAALSPHGRARRRVLMGAAGAGVLLLAPPVFAAQSRALSFYHTHTGERLKITFAERGALVPGALEEVSRFLRDFRTGLMHPIDPALLETLHELQRKTGARGPYEIISAYRSPQTNEMLRARSNGVAQGSLHMEGRAIDVRLRGVATVRLREAALKLQAGGVGYYPESDFVHVDTGRVRFW